MMKNFKNNNVLNITFTIIGTIIGAGFASGKEIFVFFNIYGIKGIVGLLIAIGLICLVIKKTLEFSKKNNINSYNELLNRTVKNKYIKYFTKTCIDFFLLISFYVMICGFSTYFVQEFQIHYLYGSIIIAVFCYMVFKNNIDGIIKANKYLIPILILFIVLLGIKVIPNNLAYFQNGIKNKIPMLVKAILYASYNIIILIPILISFKKKISSSKQINMITILVGITMFLLSLIIFIIININFNEIKNIDIPIVFIANRYGIYYKYIYGTVIILAIFTSAIAAGYGFISNITQDKKKQSKINIFICLTSIIISRLGFSNLITYLYPIFGIFGIYQIFLILLI